MTWFIIDPSGFHYPVDSAGLRIGRAADNDVVLNDDEASRYHAFVQTQGEVAWLYDRESANGVFVNRQKITAPHSLQSGDVIRLGQTILQAEHVRAPDTASAGAAAGQAPSSASVWPAVLIGAALGLAALALVLLIFVRPLLDDLNPTPVATSDAVHVYDDALNSIVFLLTPIENAENAVAGTGAVLSESGRLLTAYSLVYDPNTDRPYNRKSQVQVGLSSAGSYTGAPPDQWYQARVVRADRQRDLAVLQIFARDDGSPLPNSFRLRPIARASAGVLQPGDPLSVISYQGGVGSGQPADSSAIVLGQGSALGFVPDATLGSERAWIQSDIGLGLQHRGGLAIDRDGKLAGVYTGVNTAGAGSLLRPIEIARPLLVGAP